MTPSSSDVDLASAWRALSGHASGDGWSLIELFSSGNCIVMAGRRGSRNEESLLVGVRGHIPSQRSELPRGQGFSLTTTDVHSHQTGYSWFALVRQEPGSLELFTKVATDLVDLMESLSTQEGVRVYAAMIARIRAWQAFMKRDDDGTLSTEEEIGLFGELLVLQNVIQDGVYEIDAIDSWTGPGDGLHDFDLGTGSVEVKTTVASAGFLARIANLDQLDDSLRKPLYVAAVRLTQPDVGTTLPELVDEIAGRFQDAGAPASFGNRLIAAGYMVTARSTYKRRFRCSELTYRFISANSPRLTRANVPASIREARYTLDMDALPIVGRTFSEISDSLGV
ncbi:PD-(D/E)XK motif protein [Stenotrophomonas sp.]|uniref:PD-(D/E)XK motif protein n=1 Tax=Stenotrophomonas sp. TaxID=69392 RepID=UPI00289A1E62|nr:PD-(D/E)XK motif protein [Stenotrophomonas sp.]